jgi:hypothetical protein
LPPLVVVSYWIPIQIWNTLSWLHCLVLWLFLLIPDSNMMEYPLLAVLPPPVVVSYWIPIQTQWNILSMLPGLLPWSFLIEFQFKYNSTSSPTTKKPNMPMTYKGLVDTPPRLLQYLSFMKVLVAVDWLGWYVIVCDNLSRPSQQLGQLASVVSLTVFLPRSTKTPLLAQPNRTNVLEIREG